LGYRIRLTGSFQAFLLFGSHKLWSPCESKEFFYQSSLSGGLQKPKLEILTFFPKRYKIKDKKLPEVLLDKENKYGSD